MPAVVMACAAALAIPPLPATAQQATRDQHLKCETGPVTKDFGNSEWQVFSCNDKRSLLFVAAPGSPASPSYFVIFPTGGAHRLTGESKGDKAATDAAYGALRKLTAADVAALIAETVAAGN